MNSKLAEILNKSKMVMERAEELTPLNSPNEFIPVSNITQTYQNPYQQPESYIDNNVRPKGVGGSNLPPEIKKLMESYPSTYNPNGTFSPTLDIEMEKYRKQLHEGKQYVGNNKNDDYVLVSQKELKAMINEALKGFLTQFKGKIEEATIKKTINILLKEQKRG